MTTLWKLAVRGIGALRIRWLENNLARRCAWCGSCADEVFRSNAPTCRGGGSGVCVEAEAVDERLQRLCLVTQPFGCGSAFLYQRSVLRWHRIEIAACCIDLAEAGALFAR